jgi:fructoselysine-6-P-deglycase FrlB-like protein
MFNFAQISEEFTRIKASPQWHDLIDKFKDATDIGYIGHGGNLAVADHAAIDALRLANKRTHAPGSAIWCTSLINEYGSMWMAEWIKIVNLDLVIMFTASATSTEFDNAVNMCNDLGISYFVITAVSKYDSEIHLNLDTYHEYEVAAMALTYDIVEAGGSICPLIPK